MANFYRGATMVEHLSFILVIALVGVPVGAGELGRKGVVVRKLGSVESLAGVDIQCADKTETLTQNRVSVEEPKAFGTNTLPPTRSHGCCRCNMLEVPEGNGWRWGSSQSAGGRATGIHARVLDVVRSRV